MKVRMLRHNVLIKPAAKAKISDVIVLTEDTTAKPQPYGEVLGVGGWVTEVKAGDMVHFEQFDWNVAPGECIIIHEDEILCKEVAETVAEHTEVIMKDSKEQLEKLGPE